MFIVLSNAKDIRPRIGSYKHLPLIFYKHSMPEASHLPFLANEGQGKAGWENIPDWLFYFQHLP